MAVIIITYDDEGIILDNELNIAFDTQTLGGEFPEDIMDS
jgi:hypothetical protein